MNYLSPSLLSADFANLGEQLKVLDQAGCPYVHIDVMDGSFVPSISMGLPVIRGIRPCFSGVFDVHLMIDEPVRYIQEFAEAGADIITVHVEACGHLDRTIMAIKEQGKRVGVALNPSTDLSCLRYVLPQVDMVLLMTVNPGFGGQSFIGYCMDKIQDLRRMIQKQGLNTDIQVDGGVKLDNLDQVLEAGANVIVAGSAIFQGDLADNVTAFQRKLKDHELAGERS